MNSILLDSSYLFSLYNPDDRNAQRSLAFAAQHRFHALVPEVAITYDRRDFALFRPRHCDYLTLLPE